MLEEQQAEAQQVLDELCTESLIPFDLSACKMESITPGVYIVHFYDSRIRSVEFSWTEGESFREIFRIAVLDRVAKMSGPLHAKSDPLIKLQNHKE